LPPDRGHYSIVFTVLQLNRQFHFGSRPGSRFFYLILLAKSAGIMYNSTAVGKKCSAFLTGVVFF